MAAVESEESQPVGAQHGRRRGEGSPAQAEAPATNRTGWGMSEGKSDTSGAASQSYVRIILPEVLSHTCTAVAGAEIECWQKPMIMVSGLTAC